MRTRLPFVTGGLLLTHTLATFWCIRHPEVVEAWGFTPAESAMDQPAHQPLCARKLYSLAQKRPVSNALWLVCGACAGRLAVSGALLYQWGSGGADSLGDGGHLPADTVR